MFANSASTRHWLWRFVALASPLLVPALLWIFRESVEGVVLSLGNRLLQAIGISGVDMTSWGFWVSLGAITAFVYLFYGWGYWVASKRRPTVYVDRKDLEQRAGTRPLSNVKTAHCVWVSGIKAANSGEEWAKVKKLILPDPDSTSIQHFNEKRCGGGSIPDDIRTTTRDAKRFNVEVRWYPDFIGASWWIADLGHGNAFVHIEVVFPFTMRERRPGLRVCRWQDETFYDEHCKTFEAMWDASAVPTEEQLNGPGKISKPRRSS